MNILLLLRGTYLGAAALILVIFAIPPLRARFLSYGPRSADQSSATSRQERPKPSINRAVLALLDRIAGACVPHSWFTSFYAVSVLCSLYWATELILKGPAFTAIAKSQHSQSCFMAVSQVQVAWLMMFAQGGRRLYECLSLSRASQSQMWVGHWALGLLFYFCTNIAIWVQGAPTIREHVFSLQDLTFRAPSLRTFIGFLVFILASGFQHDCHAYLASLRKPRKNAAAEYSMPDHAAWNLSLTPHYFAECLLYLALAIVAAPACHLLNWTLLCALIFVMVNLGVTADGTKKWYAQKFGVEGTKDRARMIPFIY